MAGIHEQCREQYPVLCRTDAQHVAAVFNTKRAEDAQPYSVRHHRYTTNSPRTYTKLHTRRNEMRVSVLGPVEVEVNGQSVPISGQRQRALLAALALEYGRVVPVERLVDVLWDSHPPATAR